MGLWQCMCKSTCTKARVEGREAPQEHTHMYIWLGNFRKLFTQAPVVQTQQNLFLVFIWQVLCLLRNHAIYLCHREPVSWQNSSVVSSAMWRCSADALEFESLSTQIILDRIRLDWIGLFCIQMRIRNPWSREGSIQVLFQIKERINPTNWSSWRYGKTTNASGTIAAEFKISPPRSER